jgi:hypothetical protein
MPVTALSPQRNLFAGIVNVPVGKVGAGVMFALELWWYRVASLPKALAPLFADRGACAASLRSLCPYRVASFIQELQ